MSGEPDPFATGTAEPGSSDLAQQHLDSLLGPESPPEDAFEAYPTLQEGGEGDVAPSQGAEAEGAVYDDDEDDSDDGGFQPMSATSDHATPYVPVGSEAAQKHVRPAPDYGTGDPKPAHSFDAQPLRFPPGATFGARPARAGSPQKSTAAARIPALLASTYARYNKFMDSLIPHMLYRWIFTAVLFAVYLIRAFLIIDGWYIVTYALGIYLLNLLIGFLSPKFTPEEEDDGVALPTTNDDVDEFKPFVRRLPEYRFWYQGTKAILLAFVATFFSFFNIPVFWPILLVYFIVLFTVTMRKQIAHMRKYKYVPWSFGKRKYSSK